VGLEWRRGGHYGSFPPPAGLTVPFERSFAVITDGGRFTDVWSSVIPELWTSARELAAGVRAAEAGGASNRGEAVSMRRSAGRASVIVGNRI
jgi:hypothetical protein